ncbi:two-component system response regulator [Lysobacter sp. Root667]|uniref:response regulator n=1 Tax=Lysobacter sp. Root667 TaxID=1736581 RepID=UPI0006FFEA29|nr:response regulator [Lysobacter sp. Root667]KRA75826.1 two-component system response regulator [Lysobacter sp. Root667]
MAAKILIVEDEHELSAIVRDYVIAAGHEAEVIGNGQAALARVREAAPDLIVLDLMLPELDGLTLCRTVREFSDVPIIMTTAKVEEIDRLLGLEAGADDYLCKPYSPRELVARIAALFRRVRPSQAHPSIVEIDEAARAVRVRSRPLELTATEYALFVLMARRPGVIFSRAQLLDAASRDSLDVADRSVDSHIKNLRRKLAEQCEGKDLIQSVYGVGYRIEF